MSSCSDRQVSLFTIMNKFNGREEKEYKTYKEEIVKRFELTRLPPYLILCIKRFTKNTFFVEKNPTIVNFPIKVVTSLISAVQRQKHVTAILILGSYAFLLLDGGFIRTL